MSQDYICQTPAFRLKYRSIMFVVAVMYIGIGCGQETNTGATESVTDSPPAVTSVSPAAAQGGTTISVRGSGFSIAASENTVWFGSQAVVATHYAPLSSPSGNEAEEIQVTLPSTLAPGAYNVLVQSGDLMSNTNINFTVSP